MGGNRVPSPKPIARRSPAAGTRRPQIVLTCEHAGNQIPPEYRSLFRGARDVLNSHRGYDPGAWRLAELLGRQWNTPPIGCFVSRLLIEPNRSIGHRRLFSEFTRPLGMAERKALIEQYYRPHRDAVEHAVAALVARHRQVIHLGIHSFTPNWNGAERRVDVGLLYDPQRHEERQLVGLWASRLRQLCPNLLVRRNFPYLGRADGLTTYLRRRFADQQYCGIEVELNQNWWFHRRSSLSALAHHLASAFPERRRRRWIVV